MKDIVDIKNLKKNDLFILDIIRNNRIFTKNIADVLGKRNLSIQCNKCGN